MKPLSPFESGVLPAGFVYPKAFLALLDNPAALAESTWSLIHLRPAYANLCLQVILAKGGSKPLIPFAKDDDSNDIACFDGNDRTGNPSVFFDTGEEDYLEIDWETRFSQRFEEWLNDALRATAE